MHKLKYVFLRSHFIVPRISYKKETHLLVNCMLIHVYVLSLCIIQSETQLSIFFYIAQLCRENKLVVRFRLFTKILFFLNFSFQAIMPA